MITHPELVSSLVKPGSEIAENMTAKEADLWHGVTGVCGEAGELLEALYNVEQVDMENLIEELGDIEFYIEQVRQNLGVSRAETIVYMTCPEPSTEEAVIYLAVAGTALLDLGKKVAIYKKPVDLEAFLRVLGKIENHLLTLRENFELDRDGILAANIAKLSVRYKGLTYSDQAAQTRADKVS